MRFQGDQGSFIVLLLFMAKTGQPKKILFHLALFTLRKRNRGSIFHPSVGDTAAAH